MKKILTTLTLSFILFSSNIFGADSTFKVGEVQNGTSIVTLNNNQQIQSLYFLANQFNLGNSNTVQFISCYIDDDISDNNWKKNIVFRGKNIQTDTFFSIGVEVTRNNLNEYHIFGGAKKTTCISKGCGEGCQLENRNCTQCMPETDIENDAAECSKKVEGGGFPWNVAIGGLIGLLGLLL